ncbi:ccr4 associated factor [Cryomyces antarcticus]|uniref:Iron-sulfur cluster assembly factor IBA57 homolog, mitochondrial n=1 Tax=Cryomyces antarcticus TaxID=329879 RepID=A0ABR0MAF0_9PEZI|nr:ccr4 associated factor [Cryomyces antarcticus]
MFQRTRSTLPYICRQCRAAEARRTHTTTTTTTSSSSTHPTLPPPPPPSGAAHLANRRLIAIHGQDAAKFLQGIISNNVRAGDTKGFYAAARAQRRLRLPARGQQGGLARAAGEAQAQLQAGADAAGYLVEVDAAEAASLLQHIRRHKLRAKIAVRLLEADEAGVWSVWRESEKWTPYAGSFESAAATPHGSSRHEADRSSGSNSSDADSPYLSLIDARAPGMGHRLLLPRSTHPSALSAAFSGLEDTSLGSYTVRRMLRGVAEGQAEMQRDAAFPLNSNLDAMGAVDFRKGCYIGQELTIRTHHTGVVRKRLLPCRIYALADARLADRPADIPLEYDAGYAGPTPPPDRDVAVLRNDRKAKNAGKWIRGLGNLGLALCRLEVCTDLKLTGEGTMWRPEHNFRLEWKGEDGAAVGVRGTGVGVKAFVPDWLRGRIRVRKEAGRVE